MKQKFLFVALTFVISSLYAQKESILNSEVIRVTDNFKVDGNHLFYSLPKNGIRVKVVVKKTQLCKGPYSMYARNFLNISGEILERDLISYSIADASFKRYSFPDSLHYYSIAFSGNGGFPELQLNSDGVILGCNVSKDIKGYSSLQNPSLKLENIDKDFYFTDLGVKPFTIKKEEESFKMVETDSVPTKVSYSKNKMVENSPENNAQAAAAFILKLRKRKAKLLYGQYEEANSVDSKTLGIMIDKLDELENKYLALFIGKTIETEQVFSFDFVPMEDVSSEQKILFWFSENRGLSFSKPNSSYEPIILETKMVERVPSSDLKVTGGKKSVKYGLFTRVPGRVTVSLLFLDRIILSQQMQIAQKGSVVALPSEYLNNRRAIEFYPETGALKRIY